MQGQDIIDISKGTGLVTITKAKGNDVVRLVDRQNNNKVVSSYTYGKNGSFSKDVVIDHIKTKPDGLFEKNNSPTLSFL